MKMNDKSRSKILLEVLAKVYDMLALTLIDKSLGNVCSKERLPLDQVFSVCLFFLLLLYMFLGISYFLKNPYNLRHLKYYCDKIEKF